MRRKDFDTAAAAARVTGLETRAKIAHDVARDFVKDPARFDPKRLIHLDRNDILEVLRTVDEADAARLVAMSAPQKVGDSTLGKSGWADLRGPEPRYWIRGVTMGAATGVGVVIIIGLASALLG